MSFPSRGFIPKHVRELISNILRRRDTVPRNCSQFSTHSKAARYSRYNLAAFEAMEYRNQARTKLRVTNIKYKTQNSNSTISTQSKEEPSNIPFNL
jgi:hypothetical protein